MESNTSFIFRISSETEFTPQELADALPDRFEAGIIPEDEEYFQMKAFELCLNLLRTDGPSRILKSELKKAVLGRGTRRELLATTVADMLATFQPVSHLVIVDPYFLSPSITDLADYLDLVGQILQPTIQGLTAFDLVTNTQVNRALLTRLTTLVEHINPKTVFSHKVSTEFHDRFWIADGGQGLFIGTSLNGIGKKYAIVDYMALDDVHNIVAVLREEQLAPSLRA